MHESLAYACESSQAVGACAYLEFNRFAFNIHPHLQFHVFNKCLQDAVPVLPERCLAMAWHRDPPIIGLSASQVSNLDLFELNLVVCICLLLNGLKLAQLFNVFIVDFHFALLDHHFFLGFLAK